MMGTRSHDEATIESWRDLHLPLTTSMPCWKMGNKKR